MTKEELQKKKDELSKEDREEQVSITIKCFDDMTMDIVGPIDNPLSIMNIFSHAMQQIVVHNMKKEIEEPEKKLVSLK